MEKDINNNEVNFDEEFDKLEAYFDETEKLLTESNELYIKLENVLSNIKSSELYGISSEEWKERVIFLSKTIFTYLEQVDQLSNRFSVADAVASATITKNLNLKSNDYIKKYEERFGDRFGNMPLWKSHDDIRKLIYRKNEKKTFLYNVAFNIYNLNVNALDTVEELKNQYEEEKLILNEKVSELVQEVKQLRENEKNQSSESDIIQLKLLTSERYNEIARLNSEMRILEREHAKEIRGIEKHHKSELNRKESDFNNEKLGLLATIESLKEEIARLKEEFAKEIARLEKEHAKEITQIKEDFGEKVTDLKSSNTLLKSSIIGLTFITATLAIDAGTGFISNRFENRQNRNTIEQHQEYHENYHHQHPLESQIEFDDEFYYYGQQGEHKANDFENQITEN